MLFIRPFGLILQVVRGSMVQAFGSAYVKTARAKGVGNRSIIFVHTLRNAMLPVITVIGDQAAALLNGAVVVETIFGFPGVGKLMIDSILHARLQRDPGRDHGHRARDLRHEPADRPRLRAARSPHPDLSAMAIDTPNPPQRPQRPQPAASRIVLGMLWRDKFATAAVIFLLLVDPLRDLRPGAPRRGRRPSRTCAAATSPPFTLDQGWLMVLGADALGRPLLARIIVAAQNTLMIAAGAVVALRHRSARSSASSPATARSWAGTVIMRLADVIMSFPSLLLAVIVLYMLTPSVANVILVLAITRIPIYLRTTRAEVLEIRERMFVQAAQVMGASSTRIVFRHILPMVIPTLVTIATLDFAFVMLAESALSFLGIGIQPPEITWGLMVAQGKQYLANAWWLAFWPGLAIILTTLSLNLLSSWLRIALDPGAALAAGNHREGRKNDMTVTCSKSRNLSVRFHTARGIVDAVEGRQLAPRPRRDPGHPRRERLGQVGLLLGDHEPDRHARRARSLSGEILFDGRDLLKATPEERRRDQRQARSR